MNQNDFKTHAYIAKRHGDCAALVHGVINEWCLTSKRKKRKDLHYDGVYWCHLTASQIHDQVDWHSLTSIKAALKALKAEGLVLTRLRHGTALQHTRCANALFYRAMPLILAEGSGVRSRPLTEVRSRPTELNTIQNNTGHAGARPYGTPARRASVAPLKNSIHPHRTTQPPSLVSETPKAVASDSVKVMSAEATQPPTTFDEVPVPYENSVLPDPASGTETNYEKQKRVVDGENLHQPTAVDTTNRKAQMIRDELSAFLITPDRNIPHAFEFEANVLINSTDDRKVLKRGPDTLSALKLCPVKEMTEAAG